jgi:two-component system sensor histidine kinase KdpD
MTRLESRTIEIQKMDEAIEEVIGEALGRLSVRLSGRKVQTFVPAETPLLPMDPMLVGQVFVNLLENAIKYTPGGSPLDIRVSVESTWVKVAIVDRGPGVPVDEQEKVFEKFYRGRKVPKGDGGVGLGLTICRAIVEAHGGRMWIDNRPGGGCSVEFTLPKSLGELGANRSLPEIVAPDTMEISKHG